MVQDRWGNVWQIATLKEKVLAQPTMSTVSDSGAFVLTPIGCVRSSLMEREQAPRQGSEGAPDAWIELQSTVSGGLEGLRVGDEIVVITWFHRAKRDVLKVHPRGEAPWKRSMGPPSSISSRSFLERRTRSEDGLGPLRGQRASGAAASRRRGQGLIEGRLRLRRRGEELPAALVEEPSEPRLLG
jgi:hypothetical protein